MSYKSYIFPDPPDAFSVLRLDSGLIITGVPDTHPNGDACQSFLIPDGTPNKNGAARSITKDEYYEDYVHGFLMLDEPSVGQAVLASDIIKLRKIPIVTEPLPPEPPPSTGPDPNADPLQIINYVFNSTNPNLATASGCGLFTEDCCKELHEKMHPGWGHVKKTPGQNQFNGHAVDALMLLVPSGGTAPAIYDIIFSSASAEAKPVFNYADPVDNSLWYYPAAPIQSGQDMRALTVWHAPKKVDRK